jgi:predicted alpha/beta superfamily hydrolase
MMKSILFAAVIAAGTSGCGRATLKQPEPVQVATSYTLPSAILGQTRRINVYLPPGYAESDRQYPVLYLLDGGVQEDFVHIAGIASLAADFRRIREFIVVGIEGIDRYHDMTHPATVEADRQRLPTNGGSAGFRAFLGRELQPFVEQRFRLSGERVLIGESAAGLFVIETLLRQPDLFTGYIAVSPMLWWDGQSLARQAGQLFRKPFPEGRRLYLTIADEGGEMREGVDSLVEALKAHTPAGLDWSFVPMPGESHGTIFHPAALDAVRKLFATVDSTS